MISFAPGRSYDISVNNSTATAAASATNQTTRRVRLLATVAMYVSFSDTAIVTGVSTTSSSVPLAANWPEVFRIAGGTLISAIGTSGSGTLSVTEE